MAAPSGRWTTRRKVLLAAAALVLALGAAAVAHEILEDDPPAIPHAVEGRDDCRGCHAAPGAEKPMPRDHRDRANSTCRGAHRVAAPPAR